MRVCEEGIGIGIGIGTSFGALGGDWERRGERYFGVYDVYEEGIG